MNFIPYQIFIYVNYFLSACLVIAPWLLNNSSTGFPLSNLTISVMGSVLFFILASSKEVNYPNSQFISQKIVVLCLFVLAIILPFTHILLNFSQNLFLVWIVYLVSALQLISIIFADLRELD